MPETDVTIAVETEALDFYVVNVYVDVLIPDEDFEDHSQQPLCREQNGFSEVIEKNQHPGQL